MYYLIAIGLLLSGNIGFIIYVVNLAKKNGNLKVENQKLKYDNVSLNQNITSKEKEIEFRKRSGHLKPDEFDRLLREAKYL